MARRTELRGIANSLNSSFVSRNNEFGGYWAIGQLKRFAIEHRLTTIEFSLSAHRSNARVPLIDHITQHYTSVLTDLMMIQKLPKSWVNGVRITLDFDPAVEDAQLYDSPTSGEPFTSLCQIEDDNGRHYSSLICGRCKPHSAVRELRSLRILPP